MVTAVKVALIHCEITNLNYFLVRFYVFLLFLSLKLNSSSGQLRNRSCRCRSSDSVFYKCRNR